jgi:hypothetical protein
MAVKKTVPARPRLLVAGAVALLFAAVVLVLLLRPRSVWAVEEPFAADWNRAVRDADPPPPFTRIRIIPPDGTPRLRGRGFFITRRTDWNSGAEGGAVRVYPWLSRTREWQGALVLAADPWLIFRKLQDPPPDRRRMEFPGSGVLICPGGEAPAVFAWVSQLLQDSPGVFPGDPQVWQNAVDGLFRIRRFQNGAPTYTWVDVWPLLFRDNTAWVYAPLNTIRQLPSYRMDLLAASRFPEKDGWNEYGIHADLLWAVPFGWGEKNKDRAAAAEWLKNPAVQTLIANMIDWIPAHPQGTPYNTVSWSAQEAWNNSSFVWQGAEREQAIEN